MADKEKSGFDMDFWWEERSLPQKILWGIGFGILGIGLLAALGWAVMALWNWLMPEIFGLKSLGYWQAWGLLALSWILLVSSAVFMNWVAARVFRIGMLSYGQPLKWKAILTALREA